MRNAIVQSLAQYREIRLESKSSTRFVEILEKVFSSEYMDRPTISPEDFLKFFQQQASDDVPQRSKTILTLNEYEITKALKDIAEQTFPSQEFRYFKVMIMSQESKTRHGDYNQATKEIRIFNLSRKTAHIIKTTIHELSHHLQFCFDDKTGHDKRFYEIYKCLLEKAHQLGYIDLAKTEDQIDSKDLQTLVKQCGPLRYKAHAKTNTFIAKVTNSFEYKTLLKDRGYTFSTTEKAWVREIAQEGKAAEETFLKTNCEKANCQLVRSDEHTIESIYYMLIGKKVPYGIDAKKEGFFFHEPYGWVKKIPANRKAIEEQRCQQQFRVKPKFLGSL